MGKWEVQLAGGERPAERGLSLLECTLALFILFLVLVAGLGVVAASLGAAGHLQRANVAQALLEGAIDELLSLPFDDPALAPGGSLDEAVAGYAREERLDGRTFQIRILISSWADGVRRVSVAVRETGQPAGVGPRLSALAVR